MKLSLGHIIILLFLLCKEQSFSQVNSISGLIFWMTGDSVHVSSGNSIDICYDLSSSNNHAIQLNPSKQPSKITSNLNGHKSILFDGIDDYLLFNEIPTIRTVFWVVKEAALTAPNYRPLLGHTSLNDFHRGIDSLIWYNGAASPFVTGGITRLNFNQINGTNTSLNSKYSLISLVTTNNVKADNFSNDRINYGRLWSGELLELIIYNQPLTPQQVSIVETYLLNKYTPPLDLGPDITISPLQGCIPSTSLTIQANPDFQSYLWSNGNTTNQINVNQYGEYSVICKDIFGINHYDTIKVIPPAKNFNYPSSNALCGTSSITWNTQLNKLANQFQWQNNTSDSLFIINTPGKYYVTVTDTFGCTYNSDTVTIIQDNFPSSISLGPDLNLCAGNSIALQQGLQPNLTYTWSTGENTSAITVTNTGQYSVIATNTNNCVAKDTINVNIIGYAPDVSFSTSIACKNNAVVFTDNSSPPSGNTLSSWYWNFGDGSTLSDTSLVQNPFYTYTDTGNYTINLSVQTNVGCKQNYTKTIHVAPTPSVNFNNLIACQNDTASFSNLSASPNYNPLVFNWNFGDPASGANNTSSSANPKHVFSQQGNFPVKLITTNSVGCKDSLSKTINVKSQVKANFTTSAACKNAPTVFTDNSIVPAPNNQNIRLWTIGTNTYSGTSVTRTFTNTGVYPVTLSVSGLNGCNSSISKYLNVFLPPSTNFTVPTICANDTVTVTNLSLPQSGVLSNYNWKLNNAAYSTVSSPSLSLNSPGNYNLQLSTSNSFGCKDSITKIISVLPLPNVDFTTNPTNYYFTNTPITFSPTISNGSFYQWNFNGALYTSQSFSTNINTAGTYTNSLFMTDAFGCSNTKTKTLTISDYLLDLVVIDVKTQKDNNNFISVEVALANFGTAPINSFEISYDITDAASNVENWTGTINPGNFYNYTFVSKTNHKASNNNYITCVNINKVNLTTDDNTSNNSQCVTSNANAINIGNPFPNPTNGNVKLPVTLIKDSDITIDLVDALGQTLYSSYTIKGTQGLNLITIPLGNFSQSMYTLKISVEDKVYTKKILKSVQ